MKDQVTLIAPVVAPWVFFQVGLQILLADRVVHATDAALYKAPEALDRVGVDIAHHVDLGRVVDPAMLPYDCFQRFSSPSPAPQAQPAEDSSTNSR
jgi:hypothetical protein